MRVLAISIFLTGEQNFENFSEQTQIINFINNFRQADCMKLGSEGVQIVPPGTSHPGVSSGTIINAGTDAEIDAGGPDEIETYDEIVG